MMYSEEDKAMSVLCSDNGGTKGIHIIHDAHARYYHLTSELPQRYPAQTCLQDGYFNHCKSSFIL